MKPDVISEAATEDLLLILYGENLLKINNEKKAYTTFPTNFENVVNFYSKWD